MEDKRVRHDSHCHPPRLAAVLLTQDACNLAAELAVVAMPVCELVLRQLHAALELIGQHFDTRRGRCGALHEYRQVAQVASQPPSLRQPLRRLPK